MKIQSEISKANRIVQLTVDECRKSRRSALEKITEAAKDICDISIELDDDFADEFCVHLKDQLDKLKKLNADRTKRIVNSR